MSKYRIIEKKNSRFILQELKNTRCGKCSDCQDREPKYSFFHLCREPVCIGGNKWVTIDSHTFASLKAARAYKRDLELDDGIVVE